MARKQPYVSEAVVRRLPGYYRLLRDLEAAGARRTSSQEFSERLGLTASQVRQDLNCFGGFGQQGYGYHVADLRARIGELLGLTRTYHTIIVGAGNIGRAVANYPEFRREGMEIRALFDVSPALIGAEVKGVPVQSVEKLEGWLAAHAVDIAVLSAPAACARALFQRLAAGGVRAVWNFAPVDLIAPPDVMLRNEHLSDSLYALTFRLRERETSD
jgi:redox-sensing transcriptional repressor